LATRSKFLSKNKRNKGKVRPKESRERRVLNYNWVRGGGGLGYWVNLGIDGERRGWGSVLVNRGDRMENGWGHTYVTCNETGHNYKK